MERMIKKMSELIPPNTLITLSVNPQEADLRLDVLLTRRLPAYSREFFQKMIQQSSITINGKVIDKVSTPVKSDDKILVTFPPANGPYQPKTIDQDLGISIIHQH